MDFYSQARTSIKNALSRGDFDRARQKIQDNLNILSANIKDLQEYFFKVGSKKDNKILMEKA